MTLNGGRAVALNFVTMVDTLDVGGRAMVLFLPCRALPPVVAVYTARLRVSGGGCCSGRAVGELPTYYLACPVGALYTHAFFLLVVHSVHAERRRRAGRGDDDIVQGVLVIAYTCARHCPTLLAAARAFCCTVVDAFLLLFMRYARWCYLLCFATPDVMAAWLNCLTFTYLMVREQQRTCRT